MKRNRFNLIKHQIKMFSKINKSMNLLKNRAIINLIFKI